jgi:hypothetical protein
MKTNPSFTGVTSGEKATEVILSTDDPYLIEAAMTTSGIRPQPTVLAFDEAQHKRGLMR